VTLLLNIRHRRFAHYRVPQKNWEKLPWYAQLGLKVVYEKKMASNAFKSGTLYTHIQLVAYV
jgi:hypothetical protein